MSFVRLRRFFCTRPGALRLRPVACRKREEPAIFARSTAASFAFFPAKTSEAKSRPPFNPMFLNLFQGIDSSTTGLLKPTMVFQ